MIRLNCFTNGFAGQPSSISRRLPRQVRWAFYQNPFPGPTVFEDGHMTEYEPAQIDTPLRLGWLREPKVLRPENYAHAWERRDRFDYIFTYDRELREADPAKFKLCIRGGVWVDPQDWGLHAKSANAALIVTHKYSTPAHQLRCKVETCFGERLALYGIKEWADKATVLKPHRFVVVTEGREQDLLTEHTLDAVALGAVPVLWGPPNIGDYLDPDGLIQWDTLDELGAVLDEIERHGAELYAAKRPALERNLARIGQYEFMEDWLVTQSDVHEIFEPFRANDNGVHQS